MLYLRRTILIAILLMNIVPYGIAQVRFNDEGTDTLRINEMLIDVAAQKPATPGDAVVAFGLRMLDTPYVAGTLEGEPEMLTVNISGVDCTTFVDQMMALAMTVGEGRSSWRDFVYNLERIRYRGGVVSGYPSRLHYITDWAVDNNYRGNFKEATATFPRFSYTVKTLNFMSANADKYPALADSANLAGIKSVEIGYRGHRYPFIKPGDLAAKDVKAAFQNGDIAAFTSNIKNLDVAHLGIIVVKNGEVYVLHASSSAGKVEITETPIETFMKRNRQFTGLRVFRLNNH